MAISSGIFHVSCMLPIVCKTLLHIVLYRIISTFFHCDAHAKSLLACFGIVFFFFFFFCNCNWRLPSQISYLDESWTVRLLLLRPSLISGLRPPPPPPPFSSFITLLKLSMESLKFHLTKLYTLLFSHYMFQNLFWYHWLFSWLSTFWGI